MDRNFTSHQSGGNSGQKSNEWTGVDYNEIDTSKSTTTKSVLKSIAAITKKKSRAGKNAEAELADSVSVVSG